MFAGRPGNRTGVSLMADNAVKTERSLMELRDVCFAYNGQIALRHIDIDIDKGRTVVLQGSNGCGKSTLLKLINGLIFPEKGTYCFAGDEITEKKMQDSRYSKEFHRRVGFVFQNPDVQLFCNNVRDEIAFGPVQMGLPQDEVDRRVNDVMEMINITALADRPPYHLSGGEKKRVAIASVLTMNPEVLTLDEPLAGLDRKTQDWLLGFLEQMQSIGKTIVVSTHDDALAHLIGDNIIYMNDDHTVDYIL